VQYGIPVAQIYRAGNNPLLDRVIARFRGDGAELIPKGTVAARHAIAALRRGTHLSLLADQKMNDGIPVPFFGRPAMTAPALAVLALRFDCDVLPVRVERLVGARFRLTVFPPLVLPQSGEPHADAATVMAGSMRSWRRGFVIDQGNGSGCTDAGQISVIYDELPGAKRQARAAARECAKCTGCGCKVLIRTAPGVDSAAL